MFERTLPYSFTIFAGQGQAAPTIYVSVLNVSEGGLLSMINSQSVGIDVMESNDEFDVDFDVDPTAAVDLQSQIDAITSLLSYKQNKDTTYDGEGNVVNPQGNNHIVVDNINQLLEDTSDLPDLRDQIDQNTADIADLKALSIYGWNVVGTQIVVSQSAQDDNARPSDADLISWIEAYTGETIKKGDAIFIYWDNYASPDDVSLFWYAGTEQNGSYFRQVPYMIHMAGNSIAGLMEGNYSNDLTGKADQLMVDIVSGKVVNVYKVKHDESGLINLKTIMDAVVDITNGTSAVPKALADGNGLNIDSNYWKINAGKKYVQDYASPKALYDLNYPDYATGEFKNVNVNDTSYRKQIAVSGTGYHQLAILTKQLDADILLGDQNGCTNKLWIACNHTEALYVKITTQYVDGDGVTQTLSTTEDLPLALTTGNFALMTINSVFSGLSTPITLPSGTTIMQTIEVKREDGASVTFTLDCNNYQHEAYMTLDKIGFVRYSLELEPSAIETASTLVLNIDGDKLVITGDDGEFHFVNGESAPIATILKLPIINNKSGIVSGEIKPVSAGAVADALAEKVGYVDTTSWGNNVTLTDAQLALLTATPKPIIKNDLTYLECQQELGALLTWISPANELGFAVKINVNTNTKWFERTTFYLARKSDILNSAEKTFVENEYDKTLNLFDIDNLNIGTYLTKDSDTQFTINSDYQTGVSILKNPIPFKANTQYTFSFTRTDSGGNVRILVCYSDSTYDNVITSPFTSASGKTISDLQITFGSAGTCSYSDLMLVEGSTAHAYVPYNGAIVHEKQLAEQKVRAEVDTFDQLVPNDKINYTFDNSGYYGFGINITSGHKYLVKIKDVSNIGWAIQNYDSGNGTYETLGNYLSTFPLIYSAGASGQIRFYSNNGSNSFEGFNLIDLTADYGSGSEPSLEECKKIYGVAFPYGTNKISVLEDSQKITAFQTPIQTKVVSFNQLVKDEYINATLEVNKAITFADNLTVGHKYYYKINVTQMGNSANAVYFGSSGGNYSQLVCYIQANTPMVFEDIVTPNYTYMNTYTNSAMTCKVKLIDLTAMGLDNLTLDECKKLFNAPYYVYTSGTDMQLLSDFNGALALVELPAQEPLLRTIATGLQSYTMPTSLAFTGLKLHLPKGIWLVYGFCNYVNSNPKTIMLNRSETIAYSYQFAMNNVDSVTQYLSCMGITEIDNANGADVCLWAEYPSADSNQCSITAYRIG